jgi:hypothetical protein
MVPDPMARSRPAASHRLCQGGADTGGVVSKVLKRVLAWLVLSGLAFWLLYWVVAVGIAMIGAIAVVVSLMSLDWDEHSTFEQREADRARRRKERYERNADRRARDRARYEAGKAAEERKQARKAGTS